MQIFIRCYIRCANIDFMQCKHGYKSLILSDICSNMNIQKYNQCAIPKSRQMEQIIYPLSSP